MTPSSLLFYTLCIPAIVLFLWSSWHIIRKRGPLEVNTDSQPTKNFPKGAFVYTCESPQSYANIKSFIRWIAKSPGREAKAVVLILKNHMTQRCPEWDALLIAMEKAKSLHLLLVIVSMENGTGEPINQRLPPSMKSGVALFDSIDEARDYLEVELSSLRSQ